MRNVKGIDVSKRKLDVCTIFDDRMKTAENSKSGFKQLHSWISKNGIENLHICMESTGYYSEGAVDCRILPYA